MNKECKYCKEQIEYDRPRQLGNHVGNCKMNPNRKSIKHKLIEYNLKCIKCDTNYVLHLTENNFNKNKYIKHCSLTCANSKKMNDITKIKISKSLIEYNNTKPNIIKEIKTKLCKNCNKEFNINNRITCSNECAKILQSNGSKKGGLQNYNFNRTIVDIDKETFIYALLDNFGQIRYIGKSDNPINRLKNHIKESKYKRTHKEKWINSLLQKGLKIELLILETCHYKNWQIMEEMWIGLAKSWNIELTNGTRGGEGSDGFRGKKHTEETKLKLRLKRLGKKNLSFNSKGENNSRCQLLDIDIYNIRNKYNNKSIKDLSLLYNVTTSYMNQIVKYKVR